MLTVRKALEILEVFLTTDGEIGIAELAERTGMNISTIHRIITVMVEKDYLRQPVKRGKYSLGAKYLDFSNVFKRSIKIRETAIPILMRLGHEVGESTNIAFPSGKFAMHTDVFFSNQSLQVHTAEGSRTPLYCSGVGKIFLAYMPEEELHEYFETIDLVPLTKKTITSIRTLKKELDTVREEGVAYDDEEYEIGIRNVAAPVRGPDGKIVAAVGILPPSPRMSMKELKELAPRVKECAAAISRMVGYKG